MAINPSTSIYSIEEVLDDVNLVLYENFRPLIPTEALQHLVDEFAVPCFTIPLRVSVTNLFPNSCCKTVFSQQFTVAVAEKPHKPRLLVHLYPRLSARMIGSFWHLIPVLSVEKEYFKSKLTGQDRQRLEAFESLFLQSSSIQNVETFLYGFRLGIMIITEIFTGKDLFTGKAKPADKLE